jgi:hypothetical protein
MLTRKATQNLQDKQKEQRHKALKESRNKVFNIDKKENKKIDKEFKYDYDVNEFLYKFKSLDEEITELKNKRTEAVNTIAHNQKEVKRIEIEIRAKEFLLELESSGCAQDFIEWVKFILEKGGVPYFDYISLEWMYVYEFRLPGQTIKNYITVRPSLDICQKKHRDFEELDFVLTKRFF